MQNNTSGELGDNSQQEIKQRKSKKVTKEKGEQIADSEGFIKYIETSALFGEGVKNVFDEMIHTILKDQAKYQKDIL